MTLARSRIIENWGIDKRAENKYYRHMLIETLLKRQAELGIDGQEMARQIGISQPMWSKAVNGKRGLGVRFLRGVAARFPDLLPECVIFLQQDIPSRPAKISRGHTGRMNGETGTDRR